MSTTTGEKLQFRQFCQFIREATPGTYDASGERFILTCIKGDLQPQEDWAAFRPDGFSEDAWHALSKESVLYTGQIAWDFVQAPFLLELAMGAATLTDPAPSGAEEFNYALNPVGNRDIPTFSLEYGQPNSCDRHTYAFCTGISHDIDRDGGNATGQITIVARKPEATGVAMSGGTPVNQIVQLSGTNVSGNLGLSISVGDGDASAVTLAPGDTASTIRTKIIAHPDVVDATVTGAGLFVDDAAVWYKFTEGTGTSLDDATSGNHDGTISNGTWGTSGGHSFLTFNGTSTGVTSTEAAFNDVSDEFTIVVRVRYSTTTQQFIAGEGGENATGYALRVDTGGYLRGLINPTGNSNPANLVDFDTSIAYNDGNWHNVALTFKKNAYARIYVDGVKRGEVTGASTNFNVEDLGTGLKLGDQGTTNHGYFGGDMQNVILYKRALSVDEISALNTAPWTALPSYADAQIEFTSPANTPVVVTKTGGTNYVVTSTQLGSDGKLRIPKKVPVLGQHFGVRIADTREELANAPMLGKVKKAGWSLGNLAEAVSYAIEGETTYQSHSDSDDRSSQFTMQAAVTSPVVPTLEGYAKESPSRPVWIELRELHPDTYGRLKFQFFGSISAVRQLQSAGKVRAINYTLNGVLDDQPFNTDYIEDGGASFYASSKRAA